MGDRKALCNAPVFCLLLVFLLVCVDLGTGDTDDPNDTMWLLERRGVVDHENDGKRQACGHMSKEALAGCRKVLVSLVAAVEKGVSFAGKHWVLLRSLVFHQLVA